MSWDNDDYMIKLRMEKGNVSKRQQPDHRFEGWNPFLLPSNAFEWEIQLEPLFALGWDPPFKMAGSAPEKHYRKIYKL